MALELLAVTRQQVFYLNALTLTAGQTIPQGLGGAAAAYNSVRAAGNARLLGVIAGTTAAAAGFPRIRFYNSPGDVTGLTPVLILQLTVDPNNAFTYPIDCPLYTPWFTIEWTQGAAGGDVTGVAWVLPEASGGGGTGSSGTVIYTKDAPLTDLGYVQGTVDGTTSEDLATLGGSAVPSGALYALIQVDTGGTNVTCRWRADGTNPTASVGFPLLPGAGFFYEGPLSTFKIIGTAAGPSTVNVNYYR